MLNFFHLPDRDGKPVCFKCAKTMVVKSEVANLLVYECKCTPGRVEYRAAKRAK